MYHIHFNQPCHVHFIGIGGISMSGLAEILLERGFQISGSDAHETELTDKLERHGARISYGQRRKTLRMISMLSSIPRRFMRIIRNMRRRLGAAFRS